MAEAISTGEAEKIPVGPWKCSSNSTASRGGSSARLRASQAGMSLDSTFPIRSSSQVER